MELAIRRSIVPLGLGGILSRLVRGGNGASSSPAWHRPELEYLKAVNRVGPPKDPQLLFLLMAQYASANLHREGAEFLTALAKEFEPRLSDHEKALYLAAIGLLRGRHAGDVPLVNRIGWVRDTIALLDEAKRLSDGQVFPVRWISGVVCAQLPGVFNRRDAARGDLTWCVEHADAAPHAGWLREVYYQLAVLHRHRGDADETAQTFLRLSGYVGFEKAVTLTTPFALDAATGHTFSPRRVTAIVPDKVYALSGFEFTEYYFVVSEDRRELIGIDAGTRPDSAQAAYQALRAYAPGLPALTAMLITHAHWDHIGGHRYFRSLTPRPRFYARANYHEELSRGLAAPSPLLPRFFGTRFSLDDVRTFRPDVTVDGPAELRIGGTRIHLIPVEGGETHDALFIYLADHGVMFVGDFIMPYLGAPFVAEGSLEGLLDAIDVVVEKQPRHLLHGHAPLTRIFASPSTLSALKPHLAWLRQEVLAGVARGVERASIHHANLIPPGLLGGDPDAHLPYFVMREHVIDRIYDQSVGYWQADLQGLDHLGRADRGTLLVEYLGVSERRLVEAAERMIADGKHELAATALDWTRDRFGASGSFREVERLAYRKLAEKFQEFDPFKFILYSARSGDGTAQMGAEGRASLATTTQR